jgi:transcriptional regulator with XRE-family HTH domain
MGLIEAAVKAGISPRLLSDLEDGRQHLDYDTLGALAGVYGCRPSDLLQGGREAPAPLAVGERRDTPREVIEDGKAMLDAAMRADWCGEGMAASFAVMKLDGALELYSALLGSVIEPGEVWPHLEDEGGAFTAALRRAADDVAARAEELARLLPAAHDSWREGAAPPSGAAASGRQLRRPV